MERFVGINPDELNSPIFGNTVQDVLATFCSNLELDDPENQGYVVEIYERKKSFTLHIPTEKAKYCGD